MQKTKRKYEERTCIICNKPFTTRADNKASICSHKCHGEYMATRFGTTEERFMSKVLKTDSCWIWTGEINHNGYGRFYLRKRHYQAHRFSYMMNHGAIPKGMIVCHKCDNPPCVNPDHLFLGTHSDNLVDSIIKKRRFKKDGSYHTAKLSTSDVMEIRSLYGCGYFTMTELARKYKTTKTNISRIINRKSWAHI